jgi:urocanate hydratase
VFLLLIFGNVVDVWERFDQENLHIDLGSDQTSLHNPWAGGYYPIGFSFEESNEMMANNPDKFKEEVQKSLRRHAAAINKHTKKERISLITEMLFTRSFSCWSRCNGRKNGHRFQISKLCSRYYGTNVFRLWFWTFPLGLCFRKS